MRRRAAWTPAPWGASVMGGHPCPGGHSPNAKPRPKSSKVPPSSLGPWDVWSSCVIGGGLPTRHNIVKLRNVDHSSSDTSGPHSSQLLCGRFVADRPWGLIWFRKAQLLQNDNWLGFISVFLVLICFMFQIAGPSFFCNANGLRAQLSRFHSVTVGSSFASGVQQIGSSGGAWWLSPGESSKKNLDHWMVIGWTICSKSLVLWRPICFRLIYTCLRALDHAEPTDVTWCDHCALNDPSPCAQIRSQFSSYAVWNDSFYHSSISRYFPCLYFWCSHCFVKSNHIYICRC